MHGVGPANAAGVCMCGTWSVLNGVCCGGCAIGVAGGHAGVIGVVGVGIKEDKLLSDVCLVGRQADRQACTVE